MASQLLTVREAAERLNRSEKALRFMIHAGSGPTSALVAGRRMFRVADVDAWINAAFTGSAA